MEENYQKKNYLKSLDDFVNNKEDFNIKNNNKNIFLEGKKMENEKEFEKNMKEINFVDDVNKNYFDKKNQDKYNSKLGFKKNLKKYLFLGSVGLITLIGGLRKHYNNPQEYSFFENNKNLNDVVEYKYVEGLYDNVFNNKNVLTMKSKDAEYILIDKYNKSKIKFEDLAKYKFTDDKLEEIIIKKNGVEKKYSDEFSLFNYFKKNDVERETSKELFKKINPIYNEKRNLISHTIKKEIKVETKKYLSDVNGGDIIDEKPKELIIPEKIVQEKITETKVDDKINISSQNKSYVKEEKIQNEIKTKIETKVETIYVNTPRVKISEELLNDEYNNYFEDLK
jgi:hypothetical protein